MSNLIEHGEFFAHGADCGSPQSRFYRYQIIETARKLGYSANARCHGSWATVDSF